MAEPRACYRLGVSSWPPPGIRCDEVRPSRLEVAPVQWRDRAIAYAFDPPPTTITISRKECRYRAYVEHCTGGCLAPSAS